MTTSLQGAWARSTIFGAIQRDGSPSTSAWCSLASRQSRKPMVIAVRSRVPKGLKTIGTPFVLMPSTLLRISAGPFLLQT